MTSHPPSPPYPPPGYGGGPAYGGPGYGGPGPGAKPPFPLWPIIVVTFFFSLFGLIPTILASNRASERRESPSRYWVAFVLSFLGAIVVYVVVVLVLVLVVFATAAVAVGGAVAALPEITAPAIPGGSASPGTVTTGPCGYRQLDSSTDSQLVDVPLPPDPDPTPTASRTWTLVTSAGTVVVQLDAAAAPCTVQSIGYLTDLGFYDGSRCPRTVDSGSFVLQCGDPGGRGAGGPSYSSPDEGLAGATYPAGTVAMASSGTSGNGSQFVVVTEDSAIDPPSTVFGEVTTGLDVVAKIVAAGNDNADGSGGGSPRIPVTIVSATVD